MTFRNLPARTADGILVVPTFADLPTADEAQEGDVRYVAADDTIYSFNGATWTAIGGVQGPGPGPGTSTDNAIARWDGTDGSTLQDSSVVIDDSDNVTGVADLEVGGTLDMTSGNIENVANPVNDQDAATKDYVDSIANGLSWQEEVTTSQSTPPVTPATGDRYIVLPTGLGAWAGQDNNIAEWNGASWDFTAPSEGWAVYLTTDNKYCTFNGTAWVNLGSAISHNATSGKQGGAGSNFFHSNQAINTTDSPTFAGATIGVLTGPIKGAAGVLSASSIDLTSEVTGTLPTANGGTGSSTQTASRATETDGSGNIVSSVVTATELGHVSGVTSAIQTQIDGKQDTLTTGVVTEYFRGDLTLGTFQTDVSANADVTANTAARHDALTLGTANGLSLSTQELSLAEAASGVTGALTGADWDTFNNKPDNLQEAFDGGQSITIADGDNQTLSIVNDDTTNNPAAISISQSSAGVGLNIAMTGNAEAINMSGTGSSPVTTILPGAADKITKWRGRTTGDIEWKTPAVVSSYDLTMPSTSASLDGQSLVSTTAGVLSWGSRLAEISEDTSPQLGGNLDTNGNDIITANDATADANPTESITLKSGDKAAGTGDSGDLSLETGSSVGGARGDIRLRDGTEGTAGHAWISTAGDGSGNWESPHDAMVYTFTSWNPSGTGTTSTNPSGGTEEVSSGLMSTSFSSGTLTMTFDTAGKYLVLINGAHDHGNTYTQGRLRLALGGTATILGEIQGSSIFVVASEASDNASSAGSTSFYVDADAAETVTVLPTYDSDGISNAAQHTAKCTVIAHRLL